jgi:hypothetical protein
LVYSLAELFILACTLVFLIVALIKSYKTKEPLPIDFKDSVTLTALIFLPYISFQLFTLPPILLKWLSPMSWEVWNRTPLSAGTWHPISIQPYVIKHSLIFAFTIFIVYLWVV